MMELTNFCIYAFISAKYRFGMLVHVDFHIFITELWPFIDVRSSLPLNILRTKICISTKFCICIDTDKL